jgi:hypothetical protein
VHHPTEEMGTELPARRITGFFSGNGAAQAEFCIGAKVGRLLSRRRFAKINMLVPARNAQRDAVVLNVRSCLHPVRVHRSDQLVPAIRRLFVKQ